MTTSMIHSHIMHPLKGWYCKVEVSYKYYLQLREIRSHYLAKLRKIYGVCDNVHLTNKSPPHFISTLIDCDINASWDLLWEPLFTSEAVYLLYVGPAFKVSDFLVSYALSYAIFSLEGKRYQTTLSG